MKIINCPYCHVTVNDSEVARVYGKSSGVYENGFCSAGCYTKYFTDGPKRTEYDSYKIFAMKAQNFKINDVIIFPANVNSHASWMVVADIEIVNKKIGYDLADVIRVTDTNGKTSDFGRRVEFQVIRWYKQPLSLTILNPLK